MHPLHSVSVRGRVAYALQCLEVALQHVDPDPPRWLPLLDRLWSYTSTALLDGWQDMASECLPAVVTCDDPRDFDFLSGSEARHLRGLYAGSPSLIGELVDRVYDVATLALFGGLGEAGGTSVSELREIERALVQADVPLPDPAQVLPYPFAEHGGWGRPFDAAPLRRIS